MKGNIIADFRLQITDLFITDYSRLIRRWCERIGIKNLLWLLFFYRALILTMIKMEKPLLKFFVSYC